MTAPRSVGMKNGAKFLRICCHFRWPVGNYRLRTVTSCKNRFHAVANKLHEFQSRSLCSGENDINMRAKVEKLVSIPMTSFCSLIFRNVLIVKLIKGEEFPQYAGDSPNVFLELKLVPAMKKEILKTDIHERNSNPNFNEIFEFGLPYDLVKQQNLSFTVMYMDKFSHPFPVGEVTHHLDHLERVGGETVREEMIVCREIQRLQQVWRMVKISDVPTALKGADLKTRKKKLETRQQIARFYISPTKVKRILFRFFFGGGGLVSIYLIVLCFSCITCGKKIQPSLMIRAGHLETHGKPSFLLDKTDFGSK